MSDAEGAMLIALLAIGLVVVVLRSVGRRVWVATGSESYTITVDGASTEHTVKPGEEIPKGHEGAVTNKRQVRRSALSAILVGADCRTSTSKSVVFAWTLAVAFGLLSLLVAKWLGDDAGWTKQVRSGLQEEYLLLLGGPFAAAVLAKYAAAGEADGGTRTPAAPGTASAGQLVTDDKGDAELGDFQYVLFNLIGLVYFFGSFIGHLSDGFPDLPAILTGLVLTSTGGYAAKKLIQQAQPRLTSVVPASAAARGSIVVYGTDLVVPASAADDARALPPTVIVGGRAASVTAHAHVLGADKLTVDLADDPQDGLGTISVVRADGVPAVGPAGTDGIAFTVVRAAPASAPSG